MDDAHVYKMNMQFVGAKHLGCYSLGLDGVQSIHKDVYWFGHEQPYVQWVLLLLVLPCTGVLVVGVTSF
jgi:hypothetical protein